MTLALDAFLRQLVGRLLGKCTMRPIATTVTSSPSRTMFASPKGIV